MAELKFLRGSYTNWADLTKDANSFYIVEEQDGRFSLYLGEKFLCDGVSKADLAAAVKALTDADSALDERVKSLEALMGGEGTGSVADQIKAAIEDLDAEVASTDGTHVTVKVTEVDGVITAVNVTESDIASESATTAAIDAEISARTAADEALDARLDVIEGEAEGSIKKAVADAKAAIEGTLEDGDATTLAALNDRINTVIADGKTYSIANVEGDELSALGANVKEAFKLVDEDGAKAGEYIKVYKDSALQSVILEDQELVFTYLLANGETSVVRVDVSKFLAETEFQNGLEVVDHVVRVKIDAASEDFLTVGADGVKLSGVQAAIDAAVSAETSARKVAIEALDAEVASTDGTHVTVKVTEVDGVITAVNVTESDIASAQALADEVTARTAADEAINDKIGEVAEGKTVVEMIAAAKAAATTKVVEGTDGGNNLEVASATSEDGSVTYTINLTDVASAQALANEVTRATEAEAALQSQIGSGFSSGSTVAQAIAAEASARTTADEALDGRLDALEAVEVTGKDAIEVSESGATKSKEVSLKLATQPAEGEAGVVLSQDANGLKATLQWGTF